jgi:hypothetical protein
MTITSTLLAAAAALGTIGSTAHAELPSFPPNSIAPLYGKWLDTQGVAAYAYNSYWIGARWITYFHGDCTFRYRYRITRMETVQFNGEDSLEIDLTESEPVFLGHKTTLKDCWNELPKNSYVQFRVLNSAHPDQIDLMFWSECETADAFQHLNDPADHYFVSPGCYRTMRSHKSRR